MPENLLVVRRFVEEFLGRGDLAAADATAHPRIQGITGLKPQGPIDGREEYKAIVAAFVAAFPPEAPLEILDQFASADGTRVVTRFRSRQRHAAEFFGVAATGRSVLFDETHVARLEGGLIVENIVSATNLEFEMLMAPVLAPMILGRPEPAPPQVLARFPNGTFLENLVVAPETGRVLFTNYFARRIESWSPDAGHAPFAEVPAHPVSLTALGAGRHALAVHGASFLDGPAAMQGQAALLLLGADGAVERQIALPDAVFPNGSLLLRPDLLLLADSALGRVWAVDLKAGTAAPWLDHPLLQPDPAAPYPGVNGLKLNATADALLLSNSATRCLLRVALDGVAPAGAPAVIARMTLGVDDFAVAPDGTIFAATHAEGLARLAPGAVAPTAIAAPGVEGSTAVALTPDGRGLYALGTGGLSRGGTGEAVLARVAIPPG